MFISVIKISYNMRALFTLIKRRINILYFLNRENTRYTIISH